MKKILCLILALSCIFSCTLAFTSCDDGKGGESQDPDKAFFDAVADSRASEIKTLTYYTIEGQDPFNGTYETSIKANGDFTFKYKFTRIATLDDADNPDVVIEGNRATLSGTVYYSAGQYSYDQENWFTEAPAVTVNHPKLNLDKEKLGEYEMNEAKTSLTATLSAEDAQAVLGLEIDATSDVVIKISTNGTYLTLVSISYEKGDAKVRVDTSYS
jgi:hypothetical protein